MKETNPYMHTRSLSNSIQSIKYNIIIVIECCLVYAVKENHESHLTMRGRLGEVSFISLVGSLMSTSRSNIGTI
jgi:hypothetical protein